MRQVENLNGIWRFGFFGERRPMPPFDTSSVRPVPGCFDLLEPHCGQRGFAVLARQVRAGGLVALDIDGGGLAAEVFWDGASIGTMKYPYLPERFVFDAGTEGEHELAVVLDNRYNFNFDPNFDFFGYGGIYGDVTLTRLPQNHISRLLVSTEDWRTGLLRIQAQTAEALSTTAELRFDTGFRCTVELQGGRLDTRLALPNHRLWSPSAPNLHAVTLKTATDEVTEAFGVRQLQADGRRLLLNGEPIKLLGVNRHESHPTVGAAMPPQLMATDLCMLKSAGFNYIRGSHYAQRRPFLELCDRMGFLVWEETLGWDVRAPKLHSPEFLAAQLEQAEKLTLAHFNHPCIVIRSFLNENQSELQETRQVIKALYDKIRSLDAHTLITYASNRYEKDVCTDLVDVVAMNPYPGWYDSSHDSISTVERVKPRLAELSANMPKDKPLLITEIGAEALLGFRDPLKTYWSEEYQAEMLGAACEYVLQNDDCAGISIWHFADTRSYVSGKEIFGRARGFNNKGLLDEFRRPKLAWDTVRRLFTDFSKKR
ncbi:MAG: hypothetical protein IJJ33_05785 [Victivallales bacterium]|nr:hypothetical protein [Victivallales bacterium]